MHFLAYLTYHTVCNGKYLYTNADSGDLQGRETEVNQFTAVLVITSEQVQL